MILGLPTRDVLIAIANGCAAATVVMLIKEPGTLGRAHARILLYPIGLAIGIWKALWGRP